MLRAAQEIKPGDFESWYREFNYLADSIHDKAEKINGTRFPVSAREAYFRSAAYYRMADFFLHGNPSDPRINSLWASALADFDEAIKLLPVPATRHNVKAKNFTVPTIFFKPTEEAKCGKEKLPTIVIGTGYDGSQEELYHQLGRGAVDRGFNFVTYEGPGQPTVRRYQDLGFIPEWWEVVTPVVDWLETQSCVDMDKLALIGVSFGGALAPRAASREHRFKAVLSIDGLTDTLGAILNELPQQIKEPYLQGKKDEFDQIMLALAKNTSTPTELRWSIDQSLWAFNTRSPYDWLKQLENYKAEKSILEKIKAPVFVGEGEDDFFFTGQGTEEASILHGLGQPVTYNLFKSDLGAGQHCQIGAEAQLAQVVFDWVTDVFEGDKHLPYNITATVM